MAEIANGVLVPGGVATNEEKTMSIAQEQMEEPRCMEGTVQQRPNGLRVLRLLRELQCLEGKLAISMRHAGDFPLVTAVLAGG